VKGLGTAGGSVAETAQTLPRGATTSPLAITATEDSPFFGATLRPGRPCGQKHATRDRRGSWWDFPPSGFVSSCKATQPDAARTKLLDYLKATKDVKYPGVSGPKTTIREPTARRAVTPTWVLTLPELQTELKQTQTRAAR